MRRQPYAASGFTLMEALVTLMLISFASLLMFQTLGSYRIAKERTVAQSGAIDRGALFRAWFRDSIRGMYPSEEMGLQGDGQTLTGRTVNAAYMASGVPVASTWTLTGNEQAGWEIRYAEDGQERWKLPLASVSRAWFVYLDEAGETHREWPPNLGLSTPLPAAVALLRLDHDRKPLPPVLAAVHGTLKPVPRVFELEQD